MVEKKCFTMFCQNCQFFGCTPCLKCCDDLLRKDLNRATGGCLTTRSANDVLTAIRLLAVKEENTMDA